SSGPRCATIRRPVLQAGPGRRQNDPRRRSCPLVSDLQAAAPIVEQIEKETPNLVVYEVDFDTAKETLRHFRVQYQSTLIVFKGTKEVGRSTGDTDAARIRALVAKGF